MANQKNLRLTARIIPISKIIESEYSNGDDTTPSGILDFQNSLIHRVNIIGTIVFYEEKGAISILTIDDGTDLISIRFFEETKALKKINVGTVVLCIGRIREYANDRYIAAEIIKTVGPRWLKYRSIVFNKEKSNSKNTNTKENIENVDKITSQKKEVKEIITDNKDIEEDKLESEPNNDKLILIDSIIKKEENKTTLETKKDSSSFMSKPKVINSFEKEKNEVNEESEQTNTDNPYVDLLNFISKLDEGDGVSIELIIEKSPIENTKAFIDKMMQAGDIFQNMPGKIKVL